MGKVGYYSFYTVADIQNLRETEKAPSEKSSEKTQTKSMVKTI